jgi:hypothetical protein
MLHRRYLLLIFYFLTRQLIASESPNIGDLSIFPPDNPWNWDISAYAVHPNSDNFIATIGRDKTLHPDFGTVWEGAPIGIPYAVVGRDQGLVPISYTAYGDESDPGPFPIPLKAAIEGGPDSNGDRHVIAVDFDHAMLYELYRAFPGNDFWEAESGAKFDLVSSSHRPEGWTSADAAGLPIFPGLVRYEEVYLRKEIAHALRFTVRQTRREYIWPARHFASSSTDPNHPPMGLRFRLKADFKIDSFSEPVQVILLALKKYGMMVADNGSDWYISGAPDDRWDDELLGELKTIAGSNFEAVLTVDANGDPIYPPQTVVRSQKSQWLSLATANYPNPFNSSTIIKYILPESGHVSLCIYNLSGQEIAMLYAGNQSAGEHEVKWTPGDLASGVYFFRLQTGESVQLGKILYQK